MRSALFEISKHKNLKKAFYEIYRKKTKKQRSTVDLNKDSLSEIEKNIDNFLSFLSKDVKEKEYYPRNLKPHFIIKTNGKERIICSPSIRDKVLQKSVLHFLSEKNLSLENTVSFGFIKGTSKGVEGAIDLAINLRNEKPWVYKTDITSFFDSIDRNIIKNKVKKRIRYRALHDLIFKFIDCEIHSKNNNDKIRIKKQGVKRGVGLRQGMPISPYLSNLMLEDFDKALIKENLAAVRYADDLIIFSDSREECLQYHEIIKTELRKINLRIPDIGEDSKTQIFKPEETAEFLGIGISLQTKNTYERVITDQQKKKIKEKINLFADMKYCMSNNITLGKLIQKMNNSIDGYSNAYQNCSNIESLRTSLKDQKKAIISKIFKKLCRNFDFEKIPADQKVFFEIDG